MTLPDPAAVGFPVAQPIPRSLDEERMGGPGPLVRARFLLLLLLLFFWLAPSGEAMDARGGVAQEAWRQRTGALALLPLVALWGLAVTTAAARTRRGLRIGAAATDAALALATAALLHVAHPWIPGGEIREAWVPIFLPLALLGALDATLRATLPGAGEEVTFIRSGAAAIAAVSLVVDAAWIPAGVAVWLALSPWSLALARGAARCARGVEALALLAALAALLAPTLFDALFHPSTPIVEWAFTRYGWIACALAVAGISVAGILKPTGLRRG